MSNEFEDLGQRLLLAEDIEFLAAQIRQRIGCGATDRLPNCTIVFGKLGIEIVPASSEQMGDKRGFAKPASGEVFLREDLLNGVMDDRPAARFDAMHELAHACLHVGQARFFLVDGGNEAISFLQAENSAEGQADALAAALLMPAEMVGSCNNARELAERALVPLERAFERFGVIAMRGTRSAPSDVTSAIDKLRAKTSAKPRTNIESTLPDSVRMMLLWECLPVVLGEPPDGVRAVDGRWYVKRELYQHSVPGGWHIRDGQIVAWEDEVSR